ncbi:MAG: NAD+ synthase [Bacteroidota bacterium]|nr:NAD+ synthase [Bacteroidota bacterium]
MNTKSLKAFLVNFLKEQVHKAGFEKVVIGLSGGVDSAVSTFLAVEALGKKNVLAIVMPYKTSSPQSLVDAKQIIDMTGIPNLSIDITPMVDDFQKINSQMDQLRLGNVMARLRMIILYDFSAKEKALVVGTSNKTEILLGYGTIYGDTACAINPLGDLYKTQVWELAKELGVPEYIISKKPTADLWEGQTDEGELGFLYQDVDKLFFEMIDNALTNNELVKLGFDKDFVVNVRNRIRSNEFKRRLPLIAIIPRELRA